MRATARQFVAYAVPIGRSCGCLDSGFDPAYGRQDPHLRSVTGAARCREETGCTPEGSVVTVALVSVGSLGASPAGFTN
jgi:hypothetical protein